VPTPAPTPTPAATAAPAPAPAAGSGRDDDSIFDPSVPATPETEAPPTTAKTAPMPMSQPSTPAAATDARRVAIVSSIGDAAARSVAGFVEQLGLEPVLVGDAPVSDDITFVDRLEGTRGAAYAIVLVPPAGLAAEPGTSGPRTESLLEIGFLFGVLGRRKVLFLVDGKPSVAAELKDMVLVHTRDEGDLWRLLVAREMRKAGLDVDMNRAL
jgi:predicted nucleotide-binding protein